MAGVRMAMSIALVLAAVLVVAGPAMAQDGETQTDSEEISFEPVGQLIQEMASSDEVDHETIGTALQGFMEGLLGFLEEKGVPDTALGNIRDNLTNVIEGFLSGDISQGNFANEMANIAQQIQTEAMLQGVNGVPGEVLESSGIPNQAVERMASGQTPDEEAIPDVAESAAEAAQENKPEDAGPPDDKGPPEDKGNGEDEDEDEDGDQGPPDDAGPPEDKDDEGEDDNGEQGPPEDPGPPGDDDDEEDDDDDDDSQGPPDGAGPPDDDDDEEGGGPPN